jgi:hypothetical protein
MQAALQNVCSVRGDPYGRARMIRERRQISDRLVGGIDLTIDFATLGEYGLEPVSADDAGCERSGQESFGFTWTGWEALAPARRRGCELPARCAAGAAS